MSNIDTTHLSALVHQMAAAEADRVKLLAELEHVTAERDAALLEVERLMDALADVSNQLAEAFGPPPQMIDLWPQVRQ